MLLSLLSAFAAGLVITLALATIAIPFVLGCFDSGDHH